MFLFIIIIRFTETQSYLVLLFLQRMQSLNMKEFLPEMVYETAVEFRQNSGLSVDFVVFSK